QVIILRTRAAAQRGEKDWTVEVFIPYTVVGLTRPPAAGMSWGMQFGRQRPRKGDKEGTGGFRSEKLREG
ncbi:MAG: hypothetical protein QW828_04290, partial [Candidatus Bathyarchaeia archaeon]